MRNIITLTNQPSTALVDTQYRINHEKYICLLLVLSPIKVSNGVCIASQLNRRILEPARELDKHETLTRVCLSISASFCTFSIQ